MGLISSEKKNLYTYVSFDTETGKLASNGQYYDGISGKLLGFGSHDFEFRGRKTKKFDIYIQDQDEVYCVQFGFYTWVTFRLLNLLLNSNGDDSQFAIFTGKDTEGNFRVFVKEKGKFLRWKHRTNTLGFENMTSVEKEVKRNQYIDKWYGLLVRQKPYPPNEDEPF